MSTGLQHTLRRGAQHPFRQTYDSGLPPPFHKYQVHKAFDEMFGRGDRVRAPYRALYERLLGFPAQELQERKASADLSFMQQGVTFTVYGEGQSTERILPHDLIPRVLSAQEWATLDAGLKQRVHAINLFLEDIYHDEKILKDRIIPRELIYSCPQYNRAMRGIRVPGGTYIHVVGTDLIRVEDGSFAVLEDNLRVPSGVSYMLANRAMTKRVMPHLLRNQGVRPVDHYCRALLHTLIAAAPAGRDEPRVVVLTPGVYNSAYYEHAMLAREMGVELVEGRDLIVHNNIVYARTTSGLHRVDVIYRRLDDAFIDPVCFRTDSTLGVAGLFNAYRAGNVTLANAVGTGVADDKAIYAFLPEIIRYYLGEDPVLPNIQTFLCNRRKRATACTRKSRYNGRESYGRSGRLWDAYRPPQYGEATG